MSCYVRAGLAAFAVILTLSVAPGPLHGGQRHPVTFNRDVAPLIYEHCTACHRPGEVAPFSLMTYEDVRSRARLIADATARRFMPPWMPEPGHGEFGGSRRLADEEIQTIKEWVDDGAVEGEAGDRPAVPVYTPGWQLGQPDVVMMMPDSFVMPATGPDVFRNFVLPVPIQSRRYVRAVEFRPGSPAIHHARILVDESRESRWRDARGEGVGFGGMDAPGAHFPEGHFLGWAPGKSPSVTRLAWPLDAASDLVVQAHLKPTGRPERVQVSVGLYFADKPPANSPLMVRLGNQTFDIPAGDANFVVADSYVLPVDVDVLRIYPHAHYLGKRMMVSARTREGRVERLLSIPSWDFNWQEDYEYATPVSLSRGTTIFMYYVYDNSVSNPRNPHVPPAPVSFGPEATDEMAELLLQVVPKKAAEAGTLKADLARKTLMTDIAGDEKRVAENPRDFEARNALGAHYVSAGRVDSAVEQFRAAIAVAPTHAVAHYNLAVIALSRGNFDEARDGFRLALAARPEYPEALSNLGVVLRHDGRFSEAVANFRRALQLKPDMSTARNNLGRTLLEMERPDEALEQFRELVRQQPESAVAYDGLASAYAATGRFDQAAQFAQQALVRAIGSKNADLSRELRQRLQMYQLQIETDIGLR
jgi:Flp pilus assembly protein TadD